MSQPNQECRKRGRYWCEGSMRECGKPVYYAAPITRSQPGARDGAEPTTGRRKIIAVISGPRWLPPPIHQTSHGPGAPLSSSYCHLVSWLAMTHTIQAQLLLALSGSFPRTKDGICSVFLSTEHRALQAPISFHIFVTSVTTRPSPPQIL
ncbi:hypothetical protein BaRGS_00020237 [Batillaria attramentaria]|uniref:Uncharacterized protein n=1 Tax=Batillaria attramentaria TaxID=370345 RepID=A0ABD0KMW3_9CAEN